MDKKTLAIANELEKGIEQMEAVLSGYRQSNYAYTGFHFTRGAGMEPLPRWINDQIIEVVEQCLEKSKKELENL